jgi:predicted HTH domain antitoxin
MSVTIQLPDEIERQLRNLDPLLDEHARDLFIITNYQAGRLSTGEIAIILGFETRHEAEEWLGQRGVKSNYSLKDLESDRATLDRILGPVKR